jgi:murein DD-endopeptidase MepM/ murein hydrolase activator NlpD
MHRNSNALILAVSTLLASVAFVGWAEWLAPAPEAPVPELGTAALSTPELTGPAAAPTLKRETLQIRKRDTLAAAMMRNDVPAATAYEIAQALRAAGANLRQIRHGDQLQLSLNPNGRLVALAYAPSPWVRFEVTESEHGWQVERTKIDTEIRVEAQHGEVQQSLWGAVDSGAIAPSVLLGLVEIFESEFDFTADTRRGDRFRLLVETRYAEGVFVDHGRIVAAQYVTDGRTLTGIGFQDSTRYSYYDAEGRSLNRAFLRSPLQFARISSGFTYRRPHPILGGVRPHLAIDYAAPTGTPVWAVADGVVQFAGRNRGNGIQVLLRHRRGYRTYYNHLSRIASGVRRGGRVSQKQVIGYVGSTGLSTGPHLDYRVSHNGRFVNPLSEQFVPGKPVAKTHRDRFLQHARVLLERLEHEAPFQL